MKVKSCIFVNVLQQADYYREQMIAVKKKVKFKSVIIKITALFRL